MSLSISDVSDAAARLLATPITDAARLPAGCAGESWRVAAEDGSAYVIELSPLGCASKWRSAHQALDLAASVGVPVAALVRSATLGNRLVRAFEWVEGRVPRPEVLGADAVRRLFTDLGVALRSLHGIELTAFSSRLDGSAPFFPRWPDYLESRLAAITARCRATGALAESELARVLDAIKGLTAEIGDDARATLCHRDLHPDNLLVDPSGRLVAILDFDTAEVWDRAGEFDKLERLLIPAFPDARRWFDAAYREGRPNPSHWDERVRLVALVEALSTLPNATPTGPGRDLAEDARRRMWSIVELS